jgi:hypothetical protein
MATQDAMATARKRLGRMVFDRRVELYESVRAAAAAAGVDRATWGGVEDGTRTVQEKTAKRMEDALGWGRGSFRKILDGGGPILEPSNGEQDVLPDLSAMAPAEREDHLRHALDLLPLIKKYYPASYEDALSRWRRLDRLWGDDESSRRHAR